MKKTKCIICEQPATRSGEVTVALEEWEGKSRSTGAKINLCTKHAYTVFPLLLLNNPRIEEFAS